MSRYVASAGTLSALFLLAAVMTVTSGYPYVRQRKADPFAALATTLRQQQEVNPNYGYEEDYAGNVRPASAEDDLWRLEQLQRQLGRAAVMPFYGVRPQRSWMNLDGEEPEGHVIRELPPVVEYGVPVDEVVDQGSVWYDDAPSGPMQMQTADEFSGAYGPSSSSSQTQLLSEQERQKQAENELLLNTLAEYMLLYDSEKAAALPVGDKRTGSHQEGEQNSTPTSSPASTATTTTSATTSATTSSSTASNTNTGSRTPGQPPVQIGEDGTPMGQKEFPMMRPANTQRKQWLATQGKLDFTSKRHRFQKSQSEIITPEDRLTRELDSLKTKKN